MRIRFQADADLNQGIVLGLVRRLPEASFRSAVDAGLSGLGDLEVLAIAAREGRLLVTHDKSTMPTHFTAFIVEMASPGVLVVPQSLAISRVLEDLALIWTASEAGEWTNRIAYLPI